MNYLDEDGYPTQEALKKITHWSLSDGDYFDLMYFIEPIWRYSNEGFWKETITEEGIQFSVSTGGWSGNEDIINALRENRLFWTLFWFQSKRGGHYIFEIFEIQ